MIEDNQSANKNDDVDRVLLIDLENCPNEINQLKEKVVNLLKAQGRSAVRMGSKKEEKETTKATKTTVKELANQS